MVSRKRQLYVQGDTISDGVFHPPNTGCDCFVCYSIRCRPLNGCLSSLYSLHLVSLLTPCFLAVYSTDHPQFKDNQFFSPGKYQLPPPGSYNQTLTLQRKGIPPAASLSCAPAPRTDLRQSTLWFQLQAFISCACEPELTQYQKTPIFQPPSKNS